MRKGEIDTSNMKHSGKRIKFFIFGSSQKYESLTAIVDAYEGDGVIQTANTLNKNIEEKIYCNLHFLSESKIRFDKLIE